MFQGLSMHLANEIANTCGTQEQLLYAKLHQKDIFLDSFENDFANVMQRQDHSNGESQINIGRVNLQICISNNLQFNLFKVKKNFLDLGNRAIYFHRCCWIPYTQVHMFKESTLLGFSGLLAYVNVQVRSSAEFDLYGICYAGQEVHFYRRF